MDPRAPLLETLVVTLEQEEAVLSGLLDLAGQMRGALIASDFSLLDDTSRGMGEAAEHLDRLEHQRDQLAVGVGESRQQFASVIALADSLGISALGHLQSRLERLALDLRHAQERNAGLILGAVRLREHWFNILAGMIAPTYGSRGRQNVQPARRFVSKSA